MFKLKLKLTHTHLPMPVLFHQGSPLYSKSTFLSSVGQVMQLVLVSCPWGRISTPDRDREQCSMGRRGRAATEMTQLIVAG